MNYPDDWQQFSEEYEYEVVLQTWNYRELGELAWELRADYENMLLMGGEMG